MEYNPDIPNLVIYQHRDVDKVYRYIRGYACNTDLVIFYPESNDVISEYEEILKNNDGFKAIDCLKIPYDNYFTLHGLLDVFTSEKDDENKVYISDILIITEPFNESMERVQIGKLNHVVTSIYQKFDIHICCAVYQSVSDSDLIIPGIGTRIRILSNIVNLTEPKSIYPVNSREVYGDEKRIFNVELGDKSPLLAVEHLKTMKSFINNVREFSEVDLENIRKVLKEELSIKVDVHNLYVDVKLCLNDEEISSDGFYIS
jgi:hypothetical protein